VQFFAKSSKNKKENIFADNSIYSLLLLIKNQRKEPMTPKRITQKSPIRWAKKLICIAVIFSTPKRISKKLQLSSTFPNPAIPWMGIMAKSVATDAINKTVLKESVNDK